MKGVRCCWRLRLWTRDSASSVWGTYQPTSRQPLPPKVRRHQSTAAHRAAQPAASTAALGPRPHRPATPLTPSHDSPPPPFIPGFPGPGHSAFCSFIPLVPTSVDFANRPFCVVYVFRPVCETSKLMNSLVYSLRSVKVRFCWRLDVGFTQLQHTRWHSAVAQFINWTICCRICWFHLSVGINTVKLNLWLWLNFCQHYAHYCSVSQTGRNTYILQLLIR